MKRMLSYSDIQQAVKRVAPYVHRTPVLTCSTFNRMFGCDLFFKCENFQKAGSFKIRGACNAVFSLSKDSAEQGVATHSSGNFAQALSLAANLKGLPAYIVVPKNAPAVKVKAVEGYGGKVLFCEPTLAARETMLNEVIKNTGAKFIHPYNQSGVIAGQGTAANELMEEVKNLDMVITPVGGGGLISGTAIAVKSISPNTQVIGGEPSGADDAFKSIQAGKILPSVTPNTIADGLRTSLGNLTFPVIYNNVSEIVTMSDQVIIEAMSLIWERMKIIVEPSAAVAFGVILKRKINVSGRKVGIILSGGNVDLHHLPWMSD
jgi:threonine dehydratase